MRQILVLLHGFGPNRIPKSTHERNNPKNIGYSAGFWTKPKPQIEFRFCAISFCSCEFSQPAQNAKAKTKTVFRFFDAGFWSLEFSKRVQMAKPKTKSGLGFVGAKVSGEFRKQIRKRRSGLGFVLLGFVCASFQLR